MILLIHLKKLIFFGSGSGSYSVGAIIFNITIHIAIGVVTELTFMVATLVTGLSAFVGGLDFLIQNFSNHLNYQ